MRRTTSQIVQAMVTMQKLGGRLNMVATTSPAHTDSRLSTRASAIARPGRGVSMMAVAAGVTTSANSSRVPTTCTDMVTTRPSSTMNSTERARTGTLRERATRSSTEANSSGRKTAQTTATTPTRNAAKTTSSCGEMASRLPNSTLVIVDELRVACEEKYRPRPTAKASTVPVATSRSPARRPSAPITIAPPTQKTANPSVTGSPSSTAPVAPGRPMWASACAAKAVPRTTTK